jgi:hypothetical protein
VIDSTRSRPQLLRGPERVFLTIESLMYAGRVHCPVLILHGGSDITVPIRSAERIANAIRMESLITHPPRPTDTIDSITRQVKQKVMLLDNRWQPRIDYRSFGENRPDTIWKTMYSYRSCLAHGAKPDFKGDLQLLACLIHIFEDNKGLLCYKHVVKTMFAATKEAPECLKIAQHSVGCSQEFFASLSWRSSISARGVPTAERCC